MRLLADERAEMPHRPTGATRRTLNGTKLAARRPPPPDRVDVHVGSRIRLRRVEIGISQQELADRVGIAFQQIQKYEVGRNRVSAGRLHEIAEAVGVPVSYFFAGIVANEEPRPAFDRSALPRLVNDPSMIRLLRMIVEVKDPRFRAHAVAVVTLMADKAQVRDDGLALLPGHP